MTTSILAQETIPATSVGAPEDSILNLKELDLNSISTSPNSQQNLTGPKIATIGANNVTWNADVQSKLMSTGLFSQVDVINGNSTTPTLAQLQQYDAVLVYSDGCFQNSTVLGNNLADYVDSGGGVVVATFAFFSDTCLGAAGRLRTGDYLPFTQASQNQSTELFMVKDDPSHPILDGVNSFSGGTSSYHNSSLALKPGATLIAHWTNGQPLVGTKITGGNRVAGLNFYPPSQTVRSDFWRASTDGARLMGNSLLWAANQNDCNSFKINSLTANNASAIEHNSINSDDRGGIAVSDNKVFYTGDGGTARFDISNLANGNNVGQTFDGIFSDMKSGKVYTLANGNTPLTNSDNQTITKVLEIDGATGGLTGNVITLSVPVMLKNSFTYDNINNRYIYNYSGVFSGYGRVVLLNGETGTVYNIDLPSGAVTNIGTVNIPLIQNNLPPYQISGRLITENWANWGVAEFFDGSVHLAYSVYETNYPVTKILRTRVSDGVTSTIATFTNLSDMASFTVAPGLNRWYFHYEGTGQFRSGDETIGFADATFSIGSGCNTNTAPSAVGDSYSTAEDMPLSVSANGVLSNDTDAENNPLTAVIVTNPANASSFTLNANGSFDYTPNPDFNGSDSFTYKANDGQADSNTVTVTITVNAVNDAPSLSGVPSSATINELAAYGFTASASDIDSASNSLVFSLIGAPTGAGINASTGLFSWTPDETQGPGNYPFTVRVSDGFVNTDAVITLTVNEVNVAPSLSNVPASASINELALYSFTATASDADVPVQTLTFSLVGAPSGATIGSSNGVFSWTPTEAQGDGSAYSFTVRVSDGVTNTDTPISLTVNEVNSAPVLNAISGKTVDEETLLSVTATGSDADLPANVLTYSLDAGFPSGMTIDGLTGAISWTPSETQGAGDYPVTVRVTDNGAGNLSNAKTFNVHVNEVNVAPILTAIGNSTIDEQVAFGFTATATDADLPVNTLTFSLVGAPAGASITAGGAFSWTPSEAQGPGSYTFTVKVTDNGSPNLSDEEQITITVNEVNRPPVLAAISSQTGYWGNAFGFTATATDPDIPANTLTFSLIGAPTSASINPSSGLFAWTPSSSQIGSHTFKVRVTDNGSPNLYDEKSVTINVGKRPTALVYTGDANEQYSDQQALSATLTDNGGGAMQGLPLSGKLVGFVIGSQNTSASTSGSGIASANLILTQDPAPVYTIASSFAGDSIYLPSSDSDGFDILQEDARAYYTGTLFVNTSCATCSSGTATLSATIKDITAEASDSAFDNFAGDIRNSKVTFVDRDTNTPIAGCSNLSVGLVNLADPKTGTATCNWNVNIGSADSLDYTIGIIVSNYYTRSASAENSVLTVSKPIGTNFITGGGYLVNALSNGQYAGVTGFKTNFGFNVKYNNSGKSLQGRVNVIVRGNDGRTYQIKGNVMRTLTVQTVTNSPLVKAAVYTGKANMTDITDPLNPIALGGNNSFQMELTDKGEPGSADTIGINVWSDAGGLLFSSRWNGTRSVEQILGGGNLVVR
jgi:VCBS repeat-containing protein